MPDPAHGLEPTAQRISTFGSLSPGNINFLAISCNFLLRQVKSGNAASMNPKHMAFGILIFVEVTILDGNLRLAVAVSEAMSLAASRTLLSSSNPSNSGSPKPLGKVVFCSYVCTMGNAIHSIRNHSPRWATVTSAPTCTQTFQACPLPHSPPLPHSSPAIYSSPAAYSLPTAT